MLELQDLISLSPLSLAALVVLVVIVFWLRQFFRERKQRQIQMARQRRYLARRAEIAQQIAKNRSIPVTDVTDRMIDRQLVQDRAMLQAECEREPEEIALSDGTKLHRKKINGDSVYS